MLPGVQNDKGARRLSRVQISTMALKDNLMVAGGFQGELICKVGGGAHSVHRLVHRCFFFFFWILSSAYKTLQLLCHQYVDKPGVAFCTNLTGNNNSITNAVDIYQAPK